MFVQTEIVGIGVCVCVWNSLLIFSQNRSQREYVWRVYLIHFNLLRKQVISFRFQYFFSRSIWIATVVHLEAMSRCVHPINPKNVLHWWQICVFVLCVVLAPKRNVICTLINVGVPVVFYHRFSAGAEHNSQKIVRIQYITPGERVTLNSIDFLGIYRMYALGGKRLVSVDALIQRFVWFLRIEIQLLVPIWEPTKWV